MDNLVLFKEKQVRRILHEEEWWFVITDVVAVLTDSVDPVQYLKRIRQRDPQLNEHFKGGGQIVPPPCSAL
jgi:prophage antirepressor-like protein